MSFDGFSTAHKLANQIQVVLVATRFRGLGFRVLVLVLSR